MTDRPAVDAAPIAKRVPGRERAPATEPYRLHIRLLGGFQVSAGSRPIGDKAWRQRKVATLIKLLALADTHRLHREQVLDLLWPDLDPKAAANNLHYTLHVARRILDPDKVSPSPLLQIQGDQITLCPPESLWTDVEAFRAAVSIARRGDDPIAYQAALALYTGDLLPEDRYEDWAEEWRRELEAAHLALLLELSGVLERRGAYGAAIETLHRALTSDPTLEKVHVTLMRLYAGSGQRWQALRQYEGLRQALQGIGAEPDPSSRELYEEIQAGRLPAGPAAPQVGRAGEPGETRRHNLPNLLTSFIGRRQEIAAITRTLETTRLLTLVGAGGAGKTRLAQAAVEELVPAFPDGVRLVDLASLSREDLAPQAVARALGVQEEQDRPLINTLVDFLQPRRILLLLDNCEHLIGPCSDLAEALLHACPQLHMIATSREALGIEGEVRYGVPSLSLPPRDSAAEEIEASEAVQLFLARARARRPGFTLDPTNVSAVLQICRQVEGLPLGVELAAARLGTLSVQQIADRMSDALGFLATGDRTSVPRHRSLRGALDWSYHLLHQEERVLFQRLSVFAGGWTLEAAEAIGPRRETDASGVLDTLSGLIDKSLVIAEVGAGGAMRYHFLAPVRQYALERLEEGGEVGTVCRQHAGLFLAVAQRAQSELRGPDQAAWMERLDIERHNLRAALDWARGEDGNAEVGLHLAASLWLFWYTRGYLREGQYWLETLLSQTSEVATRYRAEALRGAGAMVYGQRQYESAAPFFAQALQMYRELDDYQGVASCLNMLGVVHGDRDELDTARVLHEEALSLRRDLGDALGIAQSLGNLGNIAHRQGDHARTRRLFEEGLALERELGDWGSVAISLHNLGRLFFEQGELEVATARLKESVALAADVGEMDVIASCLTELGHVAFAHGRSERAARLHGAVQALRETIGSPIPPEDMAQYRDDCVRLHAALGDAAFHAATEDGRALSLEQAMAYALADNEPEKPVREASSPQVRLTDRERQVAELAAEGMTNRQIGRQLSITERTVDTHMGKIFRKLGVSSRVEVATWIAERRSAEARFMAQHPADPDGFGLERE